MSKNKLILLVVVVVLIGAGFYLSKSNSPRSSSNSGTNHATTTPPVVKKDTIVYKNTDYGFSFTLPKTWEGYTIIEDEWDGFEIQNGKQVVTEHGPLVSIRHPDWDYKAPRQDIPVMVFTTAQWNSMQKDEFHIGAAPINPSEIGRNNTYVFAIPARYNYAYLTGYEEVDHIITGHNFTAFNI